ncbi:hypothetical protein IPF37_01900 [bacterium]|nr:MAG: hypothetical protein IPF37_01900 [bacterium]
MLLIVPFFFIAFLSMPQLHCAANKAEKPEDGKIAILHNLKIITYFYNQYDRQESLFNVIVTIKQFMTDEEMSSALFPKLGLGPSFRQQEIDELDTLASFQLDGEKNLTPQETPSFIQALTILKGRFYCINSDLSELGTMNRGDRAWTQSVINQIIENINNVLQSYQYTSKYKNAIIESIKTLWRFHTYAQSHPTLLKLFQQINYFIRCIATPLELLPRLGLGPNFTSQEIDLPITTPFETDNQAYTSLIKQLRIIKRNFLLLQKKVRSSKHYLLAEQQKDIENHIENILTSVSEILTQNDLAILNVQLSSMNFNY